MSAGRVSYPGGKGSCFRRVVNLMPPHRVYIESHVGGGAVLRHKRPAEASIAIDRDPSVIASWRDEGLAPAGVAFICGDASSFLARYPFRGDELVYCDPPYVSRTRRKKKIYRCEMTDADHAALMRVLCRLPCNVIVSGYRSALYDDALSDWRREEFPNATRGGGVTEFAWCNFPPPPVLHDPTYLGDTFRDRERINRQARRWSTRLSNLVPSHQLALLERLLELASPDAAIPAATGFLARLEPPAALAENREPAAVTRGAC